MSQQPRTPITTSYNGYLFRSRLEARWAVFLDALGVKYLYEYEGFQLKPGWYLPDFYLPDLLDHPMYLEIKPKFPSREESAFCAELALATEQKVVCFYGNVEPQDTEPRADTYAKGVIKKALEGPGSISYDHRTLVWQNGDNLPADFKKALLEVKPDALDEPFWEPDNEFLYWCECPCCRKITLRPWGRIAPATCGEGCRFWHDEDVLEWYIQNCKDHSPTQFAEANDALKDERQAAGAVWFGCIHSQRLLEAYEKAKKSKFW